MFSFMTAYAVEQLLTADTWEKKRQALEQQQALLLTQDAIDLLHMMLRRRPPAGDLSDEFIAQHAYLITYVGLLSQSRSDDIRQAWSAFRMHMTMLQM